NLVPMMTLSLTNSGRVNREGRSILIAVADDGAAGILRRHGEEITNKLSAGWLVAFVEVRGTGTSGASADRGPQSRLTSQSATALMLGQPLLGSQLRDLLAAYQHVRRRITGTAKELAILGDSGGVALPADTRFAFPHRVDHRPGAIQPTGSLLAQLFALFE